MNRPWWVPMVQWTLWGVLMALLMGWVARHRLKPRAPADPRRLVHPPSTLILGSARSLFFAGLAVVSNVFSNNTTTGWTTAVFVGFALLSLFLIADYCRVRHDLSEDGLSYSRLTGRRRYLKWSELRRVRYAPGMKWFRLETSSGDVARISAMLMGLPEFASLLLAHAPPHAVEEHTVSILRETAAGNPPPVWG